MTAFSDILAADFAANTEFHESVLYQHEWGGAVATWSVIVLRRDELGALAGQQVQEGSIFTRVSKATCPVAPAITDWITRSGVRYDFAETVSEDLATWLFRWSRADASQVGMQQAIPS